MAEFVTVARTGDVPPGARIVVDVNDHYIAIFNVGGTLWAIEDVCTHDGGPLAEGELDGTVIECPRHGARFDITNGAVLSMPAVTPVPWYEVRAQGDEVQVKV